MKRYISLDVLRGLTVTFMCIVNNPGSWGCMFPPLKHAPWAGCTPTDLVYPFFIFCMGVAMAFTFSKYDGLDKNGLKKIIKRGIGLFGVGLLLNLFPFFPLYPHDPDATFCQNWTYWIGHIRIFGVLQRIAMAYVIAGLVALWLRKPSKIMIAIGGLFILYTGILVIFGEEPGPFTLEGTISRKIDVALLGDNHVYHGYSFASGERAAFDPEGILGGLTAACTALLGYLIGHVIYTSSKRHAAAPEDLTAAPSYTVSRIFVYGSASLALAMILSYVEVLIPFNFGIPGIKLGLANLVVVVALYLLNARQALMISVVRILLVSFTFGNMAALLYSITGGLLSFAVMVLCRRIKGLSTMSVSVAGGISHNIGQILVAVFVVKNLNLLFYLPVLMIAGIITGLLIGLVAGLIIPSVRKALQL